MPTQREIIETQILPFLPGQLDSGQVNVLRSVAADLTDEERETYGNLLAEPEAVEAEIKRPRKARETRREKE